LSRTHDSADISCKSPPEGNRGAPTLSAAIGISVLAHAAAIGALLMLMLRPAPPLATPLDAIEVSVVPEEALARPRDLSGALPPDASADVSKSPLASLTRPDVMPMASSPDWSLGANLGRSFDVARRSESGSQTPAPALDGLAMELNCLAVRGSVPGPSERTRRGHPPCLSDDPFLRAPAVALVPADSSRPGESGADNDYRTFKSSRSVFSESPLPDGIPQANRAFETWIVRLFH
jgi:hypothetical protein